MLNMKYYYMEENETMTLKQLQKYLHCGRSKAMELIHSGVIEAHKVCGKWLVLKKDAEEFVQRS